MIGTLQGIANDFPEYKVYILSLIIIAISYRSISNLIGDLKSNKIKKLKEIIDEESVDAETKKFIKANLTEYYFKLATGLNVSYNFQQALMKLYHKNNAPISFQHFRRVIDYMGFKDGEIALVKIPAFIGIIGIICTSFGLSVIVKTIESIIAVNNMIINNKINFLEFFVLLALYFCLLIVGLIFFFRPYVIYKSAKSVNRQTNSNEPVCWYEKSLQKQIGFQINNREIRLKWCRTIIYIIILVLATAIYILLF